MDNQLQTLKLNVTNINSYLFRSNNQLQKLRKDKSQLLYKLERQSIARRKETKIEKGLIGKGLMKTGRKLLSPAMSIFDKIKEFFGILILGFVVNKLPKIITAISDILDSDFIKTTKEIFKLVGDTFSTLYNIVIDFPQFIRTEFEEQIKVIQDGVDWLKKTFSLDGDLFKGISSLLGGEEEIDDPMTSEVPSLTTSSLREIISSGEGGLNSVNRGNAGDTPGGAKSILGKNLTDMTVDDVFAAQRADRVRAVGKYQIIPDTMVGFVRYLKSKDIDTSTAKFDERIQDMFFQYVIDIKRPSIGRYIRGESDNRAAAAQAFAREFASVGAAFPESIEGYQPAQRGDTLYGGRGNNKASISPATIESALDRARLKNVETIKKRDPNLQSNVVINSGTQIAIAVLPVEKYVPYVQPVPQPIIISSGTGKNLASAWNPYNNRSRA